ncbi:MAG: peptidylprolyl isomerase [Alphaproteobacteria bacterium]|nr:peptidylprolyl isomerase [Alphaproteobacteria bacterium]
MCCSSRKVISAVVVVFLIAALGYVVYDKKFAPSQNRPADDVVVAVVSGDNIWLSDIVKFHESNPQLKSIPFEMVYKDLLNHLIETKSIKVAAEKAGIQDLQSYKDSVKWAADQVLRTEYIKYALAKATTEEKLKELYDEYVKQNPPEEEVRASHILVDSEDDAKDIIKQIADGADFAALAKEKSKDSNGSKGGDLGYFKKSAMVPEFANAAFSMEVGTVSEKPIKTMFGYHVVKVTDKRLSQPVPMEQVKEMLQMMAAEELLPAIVREARESAQVMVQPEAYKNKLVTIDADSTKKTEPEAAPAPAEAEAEAAATPVEVEAPAAPAAEAEAPAVPAEAAPADEAVVEEEIVTVE